jgi:hypothetical protein
MDDASQSERWPERDDREFNSHHCKDELTAIYLAAHCSQHYPPLAISSFTFIFHHSLTSSFRHLFPAHSHRSIPSYSHFSFCLCTVFTVPFAIHCHHWFIGRIEVYICCARQLPCLAALFHLSQFTFHHLTRRQNRHIWSLNETKMLNWELEFWTRTECLRKCLDVVLFTACDDSCDIVWCLLDSWGSAFSISQTSVEFDHRTCKCVLKQN